MLSAALVLLMMSNKPLCIKKNQGLMWPAIANADKAALLTFARAGSLEMCVASTWGYKWERVTVNVHQAGKKSLD